MARLRLISFKLCPYVQRAVITLELKRESYEIKYIDLANKPEWFLQLSPLGKVPVLQVDDEVLFESAVINEYLDETLPPQLLPVHPLQRARHRAWIQVASELFAHQYQMVNAANAEACDAAAQKLASGAARIADQLTDGPYFGGNELTLVDASIAPLFVRQAILDEHFNVAVWSDNPALTQWRQALLALDAVKNSVVPDFEALYVEYVSKAGALAKRQA